jgi:hypothetical protein
MEVAHMPSIFVVLEITKSGLRRKLDNFHNEKPEAKRAYELLERRGNEFTLEELQYLAMFLSSAHDSCVTENPEDFSRVEVWQSVKQEERADRVYGRIQMMMRMERESAERREAHKTCCQGWGYHDITCRFYGTVKTA